MPMFRYAAKQRDGRAMTGTTEATDQKALVDALRKQELIIISIKEEKKKESMRFFAKFGGKIKLGELVLFSRQMATRISVGSGSCPPKSAKILLNTGTTFIIRIRVITTAMKLTTLG